MTAREAFVKILQKFFVRTAMEFDDIDAKLYIDGLKPVGFEKAADALYRIAQKTGFNKIPTVAQILEEAGYHPPDEKDKAVMVSATIIGCISRFGWCNEKEARAHMGEFAWTVVEKFGGWGKLCDTQNDKIDIVRAQLREFCKAVSSYESVGGYLPGGAAPLRQVSAADEALAIASQGIRSVS